MTVRRPVVRVGGRYRQLAPGDTLPSSILGYPAMRGDEVAALPDPRTVPRQLRVLTINSRVYWSDGVTWIDMTATGGRGAEFHALEAETYVLIASQSSHPTVSRAGIINTLVSALKSGGVWQKLGLMYVLAAADEQAARLNWKSPGVAGTLTAVNSPTFAADRGFSGDGVASYLDTNVQPSSLQGFDLNAGFIAGWGLRNEETVTTNTNQLVGTLSSPTTQRFLLISRTSANKVATQINGPVANSLTAAGAGNMFVAASRKSASTVSIYQSGVNLGDFDSVAEAVGNFSIVLLRNSSGRSTQQIAFAAAGGTLSDGEMNALYTAVRTYLQSLGAVA